MPIRPAKNGSISSHGYLQTYVGKQHHLADIRGYAYVHRLVAEVKMGRRLKPGELVHHANGIRLDNTEQNIQILRSIAAHKASHPRAARLRRPGQNNPLIYCSCGCGKVLPKYDSSNRPRSYLVGCSWRKGKKGGWD